MKTSSCSFGIHLSCPISSLSSKAVSLKFNKETSDAARRLRVGGSLRELSGDFIAGLVTSDGVFSARLTRRGNKNNYRFRIDLKFTIQLSRTESNKNLLLGLKEKFDNKGNFILYKKQNNTILYQITNQKDLLNVVIPFFMNYQLRGEKLLSFLRFKYILESVLTKSHLKDKNIFLSLIVIGGQCNPQGKLGNKIRYLKPDEIYYVKNNIIPEGVDISKLTESIANFKPNPLTLDFVHGLFELNADNFFKLSKQDQDYIRENFLPKGLEHWKFKEYYKGLNHKLTNGFCLPAEEKSLSGKRSYSTKAVGDPEKSSTDSNFKDLSIISVKLYKNASTQKLSILRDNRNKSGIYRWINQETGKSYVGSATNLYQRFNTYYSRVKINKILARSKSLIFSAILKYDYSKFTLEILEYCDSKDLIKREQYYIDLLKPEYNILKLVDSFIGHKHPEDSLTKNWTEERKAERMKQLEILNSNKELNYQKLARLANWNKSEKAKEHLKNLAENRSKKIKILDTITNETTVYNSIEEAARVVGRDSSVIRLVMKNIKEKGISRRINGRYLVVLDGFKVIQYTNPDLKIRIEVTDTWTSKKTVYETQVEAAKAIGSVSSNVANALKKASDGVSKLIKKRYTVKLLKD
jgi:group I intron endonuclease